MAALGKPESGIGSQIGRKYGKIGNMQTERLANTESPLVDAEFIAEDGNTGETGAAAKRPITNFNHAFRNSYAGESGAIAKGTSADFGHAFRNSYAG